MHVERHKVGETVGHAGQGPRLVEAYTLHNERGLSVTIWTYGASLIKVRVPNGREGFDNLVVRLPDLFSYECLKGRAYVGATMGRYARCVSGSRVHLDGRNVDLAPNYGRHHLHGGPLGFDAFVWDSRVECVEDCCALRLKLVRPDGDQGYPGEITAETTYLLGPENTLTFEHRATTTAPTLCDITNHAMWNLSGGGTIDGHVLEVNADRVLLVDEDLIPSGDPAPVVGTRLDLRSGQLLAGLTLDNCYVLNEPGWSARLFDPSSDRRMTIFTNQPGLQIYTGDGFAYPRAGICLQTGSWPNAPVRPDFPSARLDSGEVYLHRTVHHFDRLNLVD